MVDWFFKNNEQWKSLRVEEHLEHRDKQEMVHKTKFYFAEVVGSAASAHHERANFKSDVKTKGGNGHIGYGYQQHRHHECGFAVL